MHHHSHRHPDATLKMARILGWLSIGLGVAELLAPRQVGRAVGMEERSGLVRLHGGREIVKGVGILRASDPLGIGPGRGRRACDGHLGGGQPRGEPQAAG